MKKRYLPVYKYIKVKIDEEKQDDSKILKPESYKEAKPFTQCKVLAVGPDVTFIDGNALNMKIIVKTHMIEEFDDVNFVPESAIVLKMCECDD